MPLMLPRQFRWYSLLRHTRASSSHISRRYYLSYDISAFMLYWLEATDIHTTAYAIISHSYTNTILSLAAHGLCSEDTLIAMFIMFFAA